MSDAKVARLQVWGLDVVGALFLALFIGTLVML
jgi:hypothetical protein